jgi:hypothetical protein
MGDAKIYQASCSNTGLFAEVVLYLNENGAKTGIVEGYDPHQADLWDVEFQGLMLAVWSDPLDKTKPENGQRVTLRANGEDISDKLVKVLHEFDFRELPDPNK